MNNPHASAPGWALLGIGIHLQELCLQGGGWGMQNNAGVGANSAECPAQAPEPRSSLACSSPLLTHPRGAHPHGRCPAAVPGPLLGGRTRGTGRMTGHPRAQLGFTRGQMDCFISQNSLPRTLPNGAIKKGLEPRTFTGVFYLCECPLSFIPLQGIRRPWAE